MDVLANPSRSQQNHRGAPRLPYPARERNAEATTAQTVPVVRGCIRPHVRHQLDVRGITRIVSTALVF